MTDSIAQWSTALAHTDRSAHTIRAYTRTLAEFMTWYESVRHLPCAIADLTPLDGKGYREHLQQYQLAPASINQAVAALRAFGSWLVDAGHRPDNPFRTLKMVEKKNTLAPKALSAKEVNALLRESQAGNQPLRDYAILQVLVQTGLRRSECAALRLGDITLSERAGTILVRDGKGMATREVPLNASARQALADYLGPRWRVDPTVKAVAATWPDREPTAPLWLGQRGGLKEKAISYVVDGVVERCAMRKLVPPDTSAHTLRHTFATLYLASHPGDLVGLAAILGHSTIETTKIYVQPSDAELQLRVERSQLNAYE